MKPIVLFLFLTLTLALTSASHADNGISKQQAISIAQKQNPGRVLAVKQQNNSYRIKMLSNNGEVRVIVIDASTGKPLK